MTQTHEEWLKSLKEGDRVEFRVEHLNGGTWTSVTVVDACPRGWPVMDWSAYGWGERVSLAKEHATTQHIRPVQSKPVPLPYVQVGEPGPMPVWGPITCAEPSDAEKRLTAAMADIVALEQTIADLRAEIASLRAEPEKPERGAGLLTVNGALTSRWGR